MRFLKCYIRKFNKSIRHRYIPVADSCLTGLRAPFPQRQPPYSTILYLCCQTYCSFCSPYCSVSFICNSAQPVSSVSCVVLCLSVAVSLSLQQTGKPTNEKWTKHHAKHFTKRRHLLVFGCFNVWFYDFIVFIGSLTLQGTEMGGGGCLTQQPPAIFGVWTNIEYL